MPFNCSEVLAFGFETGVSTERAHVEMSHPRAIMAPSKLSLLVETSRVKSNSDQWRSWKFWNLIQKSFTTWKRYPGKFEVAAHGKSFPTFQKVSCNQVKFAKRKSSQISSSVQSIFFSGFFMIFTVYLKDKKFYKATKLWVNFRHKKFLL